MNIAFTNKSRSKTQFVVNRILTPLSVQNLDCNLEPKVSFFFVKTRTSQKFHFSFLTITPVETGNRIECTPEDI